VDPWPYAEPSRIDEHLEKLAALRARIRALMVTMGGCGSPGDPHIFVTIIDRKGQTRTVCAKCGLAG
jgi:hypothetical protein